ARGSARHPAKPGTAETGKGDSKAGPNRSRSPAALKARCTTRGKERLRRRKQARIRTAAAGNQRARGEGRKKHRAPQGRRSDHAVRRLRESLRSVALIRCQRSDARDQISQSSNLTSDL